MSNTGRYTVYKLDFKKGKMIPKQVVEPITPTPCRNADWGKTDTTNLPSCGAIEEKDSIITKENGFKNISYIVP